MGSTPDVLSSNWISWWKVKRSPRSPGPRSPGPRSPGPQGPPAAAAPAGLEDRAPQTSIGADFDAVFGNKAAAAPGDNGPQPAAGKAAPPPFDSGRLELLTL
ncbi:hypothetical protein EYF80_065354 [Liparis tanakae]|uniref:Uncharacterized protein n=1 Tax=Liparis tanakae TaxID=230148 RepID=A0A4Z2E7H4_9TELE|nr:hypothetical protein EYF80_065354 [Liparis tanakae]